MGKQTSLTLNSFVYHLFLAMSLWRTSSWSFQSWKFHEVFDKLSDDIQREAKSYKLFVMFSIRLHPITHISPALAEAVDEAIRRKVAVETADSVEVIINRPVAIQGLMFAPGVSGLYERLSQNLVQYYSESLWPGRLDNQHTVVNDTLGVLLRKTLGYIVNGLPIR